MRGRAIAESGYPGFGLAGRTPGQSGALTRGDSDKWAPVIRTICLKID